MQTCHSCCVLNSVLSVIYVYSQSTPIISSLSGNSGIQMTSLGFQMRFDMKTTMQLGPTITPVVLDTSTKYKLKTLGKD